MALRSLVGSGLLLAVGACGGAAQPVEPWRRPAPWPYEVESPRAIVHYQADGDRATAEGVLAGLEQAWQAEIVELGGLPPLDDGGRAGPDGRFDVYLQRGINTLSVESVDAEPATPNDDASTAMVIDPWGKYGGAEMLPNLYHELRHGSEGADDWNEHIAFFEADATLWETSFFGYQRLAPVWLDYQAHPDWTPFRDDHYRTWFMYGGALFLAYLRDHVFDHALAFTNEAWRRCRNPPGVNEPDFADALDAMLAARGTSLFAELTSFARARWYTGDDDDGSLDHGKDLPPVARATVTRPTGAARTKVKAAAQLLGTSYTVLRRASTDGDAAQISLGPVGAGARAVVQVVGQRAGDRVLDLGHGPVRVPYVDGALALAVTVLPADGRFDPDLVSDEPVAVTVLVDR